MRIIGIDLGSYNTGYGIIDIYKNKANYLTSGCIKTNFINFYDRLSYIYLEFLKIFSFFKPNNLVIEKNFLYKNCNTLIKLSQLSGVIMSITFNYSISIFEYSVKEIRKLIYSYGNINKSILNKFICNKFNIDNINDYNITDAIAVALAHFIFKYKNI